MHPALFYAIGLLFCCGMFFVGRAMRRAPAKTLRLLSFGQESMFGKHLGEKFCFIFGTFFLVLSLIGVLLYAVAMVLSLIEHR